MLLALRDRLSHRALGVVALAAQLALPACAYESSYAAPRDGRARAVWKGNDVTVDLGDAPASDACQEQLRAWSASGRLRLVTGDVKRDQPPPNRLIVDGGAAFWVPVYYGPAIVPPGPGLVLHPKVVFAPALPPPVIVPPIVHAPSAGSVGTVSGGSGGSGDLGKLFVIMAVIALVVLPIVDIAVAAATPENDRSSDAIDQVNVFNDLARSSGSPCTYAYGALK